ncbi:hypothetical protein [Hymenobacter koreensis]|uniref:Uncharacterized protein n=1 Tax=Hymenobacter koreensis TaxID=1084523 RepID=A0ABP8JKD5_9BACT
MSYPEAATAFCRNAHALRSLFPALVFLTLQPIIENGLYSVRFRLEGQACARQTEAHAHAPQALRFAELAVYNACTALQPQPTP